MRVPVDLIRERFVNGAQDQLEGEHFVDVPERATQVGPARVFEAVGWLHSRKCFRCAGDGQCIQLVGVYPELRAVNVAHEYDRDSYPGDKPWPRVPT